MVLTAADGPKHKTWSLTQHMILNTVHCP